MFSFFKVIKSPTVTSALSDLEKAAKRLVSAVQHHRQIAEFHHEVADTNRATAHAHELDAERAERVADKLIALVS